MVKHKRNIIIVVCFLLILSVGAYSFAKNSAEKKSLNPAFAAQKQRYEILKAECEKEYLDLLHTSGGKKTLEEINRRHERGLALKQKSGELAKLKQEVDPPTPEEILEKTIGNKKCALEILKKTNPEDTIKLDEKLQKVIQIEKDYKEQKKPATELLQELEELSKIKIKNEPAKPNPYREIEYIQ